MFNVLRRRMLVFTMGLISIVVIGAFAAVYTASELAMHQINEMRLYALHNATLSTYATAQGKETVETSNEKDRPISSAGTPSASPAEEGVAIDEANIPKDGVFLYSSYFITRVSAAGNIEILENSSNLDDATCRALAADTDPESMGGEIRSGGQSWRFLASEETGATIIAGSEPSSTSGKPETGRLITFYDAPSTLEQLRGLAATLVAVAALALLAALLISWLIASRAIRPAQAAWERERQFVADASHELKTPLSIVCSSYDVLAANADQTVASQQRWMEGIRYGTDRMEALIDSMLALSRADEGEDAREDSEELFDLGAIATKSIRANAARAAEKGIVPSTAIDPGIMARGDRETAEQILDALMDNALKYTDPHGSIAIIVEEADGRAVFRITNTGQAVAEGDLPHVFDRFWRADRSRADNGSAGYGLGLSIARACAERLGGTLTAQSDGNSMAFELSLPQ